jgi:hypothetical protein
MYSKKCVGENVWLLMFDVHCAERKFEHLLFQKLWPENSGVVPILSNFVPWAVTAGV